MLICWLKIVLLFQFKYFIYDKSINMETTLFLWPLSLITFTYYAMEKQDVGLGHQLRQRKCCRFCQITKNDFDQNGL